MTGIFTQLLFPYVNFRTCDLGSLLVTQHDNCQGCRFIFLELPRALPLRRRTRYEHHRRLASRNEVLSEILLLNVQYRCDFKRVLVVIMLADQLIYKHQQSKVRLA